MRMGDKGQRKVPASIDDYIAGFPEGVQGRLQSLRRVIKEEAPDAEEVISYGMPAFKLNRILVYFAAHKEHIGFYPKSSGIEAFREELSSFKQSKGGVQFPYEKPLPLETVRKIVRFRVREELAHAKRKR